MKLLLLAFEPIGSLRLDPSGQVAEKLCHRLSGGGVQAEAALVPGAFSRYRREADQAIEKAAPQVVVALAQRGSCRELTFEKRACNRIDAPIPDREGVQPRNAAALEGGADVYETALPLDRIAEAVRRQGIPAGISTDAGTFLCNALYYHLLRSGERGGFDALFVHLPYLRGQDVRHREAGMEIGQILRGLEAGLGIFGG